MKLQRFGFVSNVRFRKFDPDTDEIEEERLRRNEPAVAGFARIQTRSLGDSGYGFVA